MAVETEVLVGLTRLELKAIWVRLTGGNTLRDTPLREAEESALQKVYQAELRLRCPYPGVCQGRAP
jgi:hypothetical protein